MNFPGPAVKLGILLFVVPAGPGFDLWGAQQIKMATLPEAGLRPALDLQAVTCVRLCLGLNFFPFSLCIS
jgi:hypothetical protein